MKKSILTLFAILFLLVQSIPLTTSPVVISVRSTSSKTISNENSRNSFKKENFVPFTTSTNVTYIAAGSNADITAINSPTGSGTQSDPYIFQNFNISNTDSILVHIENTDKYIVIKNNIVDGQGSNSLGFVIKNATHITIDNNYISGVLTAIDVQNSSTNIISNNLITNLVNPRVGIIAVFNNNTQILNNDINTIDGYTIEFYYAISCQVSGNNLNNSQYGLDLMNVNNSLISNNMINTPGGIYLQSSSDDILQSNFVASSGIGIYYGENITIVANSLTNSDYGIKIEHVSYSFILDNILDKTSINGVQIINYSHDNVIRNNFISDSKYGIYVYYSNANTFENNTITHESTGLIGIHLLNANFNLFTNNTSEKQNLDYLIDTSNYNSIIGDTFKSEKGNGTELLNANYNKIINSTFYSGFDFALVSINGTGNKIFGNSFNAENFYSVYLTNENNDIIQYNKFLAVSKFGGAQAFTDNNNSIFRYNYWTGWTSPDNNKDGYVDEPYLLDGPSRVYDTKPLSVFSQFIISPTEATSSQSSNSVTTTNPPDNGVLFTTLALAGGLLLGTGGTIFIIRKRTHK